MLNGSTLGRPNRSNPSGGSGSGNNATSSRQSRNNPLLIVSWIATTVLTFYAGVMIGMHTSLSKHSECIHQLEQTTTKLQQEHINRSSTSISAPVVASSCNCEKDCSSTTKAGSTQQSGTVNTSENKNNAKSVPLKRFTPGMSSFAGGAAYTKKESFMKTFDYGYPQDMFGGKQETDVLLLYNTNNIPNSIINKDLAINSIEDGLPYIEDPLDATSNCPKVNVILSKSPCLAIMWQYESFHIERWARLSKDKTSNLTVIGRGRDPNSYGDQFSPPSLQDTRKHWNMLQQYLDGLEDLINALRPLTKKIAINNTIIVMVCNYGQSPLLLNFACSCRSRGFDISNILVFATDIETLHLATSLGMTAYFDEKNFGDLPNEAAKSYADRTFKAMMFAKVVSVQIINFMGYDVLFQDVDMHWYTNPLDKFHDKQSSLYKFDILFQDDGARSLRYTPYSANSGFYYVRYNDRTRYLLTSLLVQSDMIVKHASHQQVLVSLLAEHSSLTGLRVKILSKDDYPGGFDYHRRGRWNILRDISNGIRSAEIFHMSWTKNKDNKLLFMKQMGMWHLKDTCVMKPLSDIQQEIIVIEHNDDENDENDNKLDIFDTCCSIEPIITCHYRDKPSIINCNHKDPIDKNGRPFWIEKKT